MVVFAAIVSIILAFIKHSEAKPIARYALKLFLYMVGGVVLVSWIMHLV
jgi:hypothetical protein